jgi:rubredoxin
MKHRIKWKCLNCGFKNSWRWAEFDDVSVVTLWVCDVCGTRHVFEMYEKAPGRWRRK